VAESQTRITAVTRLSDDLRTVVRGFKY
jgi:hypothetical protein